MDYKERKYSKQTKKKQERTEITTLGCTRVGVRVGETIHSENQRHHWVLILPNYLWPESIMEVTFILGFDQF